MKKHDYELFGKLMWELVIDINSDLCGDEWSEGVLSLAQKAGLCERVAHDPNVHGDIDVDVGDKIWWCGERANKDNSADRVFLWWDRGYKSFRSEKRLLSTDRGNILVDVELCSWNGVPLMISESPDGTDSETDRYRCSHEPTGAKIAGGENHGMALLNGIARLRCVWMDLDEAVARYPIINRPFRGGKTNEN